MMGMPRTPLRVLAAGAVTALALTACGGPAPDGDTYKWGVNSELSGVMSPFGATAADGVAAYVDQVNANGGINGHKIELKTLDNAGDQSRAAANATQLATVDKVNAIFGNALSANCSAAQPVVERYEIPQACLSVAEPGPYAFNLGPDLAQGADPLFASAKKLAGKADPKVAFAHLNTLTGIALAKSVKEKAGAAGVTVATSQQIDLKSTDVSGPVARIVASQPDAVLLSNTSTGLLNILKGVRAAGLKAPVIWLDGTGQIGALAQTTDNDLHALSVWQLVDPASTQADAKEFISAITPKLKKGMSATALNDGQFVGGYVTARAFGEAMKTCGHPCSGAKLKTELEKTKLSLPGLVSSFSYTADDHYPYENWYLYDVKGTSTSLLETLPASGS